nr:unnamed protein product [Macaca fascicularis]
MPCLLGETATMSPSFRSQVNSMVSGNTVIVPRAFEESTLEKRERERETN